jgi:hypothetical protein
MLAYSIVRIPKAKPLTDPHLQDAVFGSTGRTERTITTITHQKSAAGEGIVALPIGNGSNHLDITNQKHGRNY